MNRSTISGEQFDRHPKKARKAADKGPVFIREGCRNSFVLLTIEEYRKIGGKAESILDLIPTPGAGAVEFEPPHTGDGLIRPVDFS
jgi:hypothetical protein